MISGFHIEQATIRTVISNAYVCCYIHINLLFRWCNSKGCSHCQLSTRLRMILKQIVYNGQPNLLQQLGIINLSSSIGFSDGKRVVLPRRIQKDICLNHIEPKIFQCIHSIKKSPQAVAEGDLYHSCLWVRIKINYNFWSRNIFCVAVASILNVFNSSRQGCM
uniref:Uncharacterized protein n=1 Tax=Opuntia streptacantha TaxID=393608 RepID=A0A7C9E8I2_OPUST